MALPQNSACSALRTAHTWCLLRGVRHPVVTATTRAHVQRAAATRAWSLAPILTAGGHVARVVCRYALARDNELPLEMIDAVSTTCVANRSPASAGDADGTARDVHPTHTAAPLHPCSCLCANPCCHTARHCRPSCRPLPAHTTLTGQRLGCRAVRNGRYVGIAEKITGRPIRVSSNPRAEIIAVLRDQFQLVDEDDAELRARPLPCA